MITSIYSNPYEPYMKYNYNFYKRNNVNVSEITSIWAPGFEDNLLVNHRNLLVLSNREVTGIQTLKKLTSLKARKLKIGIGFRIHLLEMFYDSNIHERELNVFAIEK